MTTRGRRSSGKQGGGGPRVTMLSMTTSLCRVSVTLLLFYHHPFMTWASAVTPMFNETSSNISQVDSLPGIQVISDHIGFNAIDISSSSNSAANCGHLRAPPPISMSTVKLRRDVNEEEDGKEVLSLKLHLKRRLNTHSSSSNKSNEEPFLTESLRRDLYRIHTLQKRITQTKQKNRLSRRRLMQHQSDKFKGSMTLEMTKQEEDEPSSLLMTMNLESGFSQGSGEYFTDVYVGTPPRHFSLILDTGSDLNWIQCLPCHDCFEQNGPYYDPKQSTSYRNVSCADEQCSLVTFPNHAAPELCRSDDQTCPYFYWYGDRSNTTGDLALETFTINMTTATSSEITKNGSGNVRVVENVIFGCGHWNRGLFHGAAGLLGLGRGPLSFASQLRSLYGSAFSYCLVDRNKDGSISGKLILGEDKTLVSQQNLNFTDFVRTKTENDNNDDVAETTFYYVGIKGILVGGEMLAIQPEAWELSDVKKEDRSDHHRRGLGTIIDSGTTLSYFVEPAHGIIKDAFVKKLGDTYPRVNSIFPLPLEPCYNISGVADGSVDMPEFAILFKDGAVWNFPPENYFIAVEEGLICLAILATPPSSPSILGNYLQQNFHVLYDLNRSRLGFAPTDCANL